MKSLALMGLGFTIAGCAASVRAKSENLLLKRAAFDLRCEKGKLVVTPLDDEPVPDTVGVDGCGVRATYIWDRANNVWLLNTTTALGTQIERAPAASQPASKELPPPVASPPTPENSAGSPP